MLQVFQLFQTYVASKDGNWYPKPDGFLPIRACLWIKILTHGHANRQKAMPSSMRARAWYYITRTRKPMGICIPGYLIMSLTLEHLKHLCNGLLFICLVSLACCVCFAYVYICYIYLQICDMLIFMKRIGIDNTIQSYICSQVWATHGYPKPAWAWVS